MNIPPFIIDAGAASTAIVAVWQAWVKIVKPWQRKLKHKKQEYYNKLDEIHKELKFNGGGSVKDVVYGLQESVRGIGDRLDGIEENQKLGMNLQNISYWISDKSGNFTYASPALCKVMGRSESEILQKSWMAWIHPEDKERVVDAWAFSVENTSAFDEIFSIRRPGGEFVEVWAVAFPKASKSSTLGGVLGKMVVVDQEKKVLK